MPATTTNQPPSTGENAMDAKTLREEFAETFAHELDLTPADNAEGQVSGIFMNAATNAAWLAWSLAWVLFTREEVAAGALQRICHGAASRAGWWMNPNTGEPVKNNPYCFSNKLMLIVSELAEAMEGDRKGLMDDKLPHRAMREVELADAVIRIFDLAGAYGMDLGGAIREKLAFNARRPDHKLSNRQAAGGKAY